MENRSAEAGAVPVYDAGPDVSEDEFLCLHRNENLFVGEEWTVDLARDLIREARIGAYPEPTSLPLREAIGESLGLGPEHVFVGNGSDEVLSDLLGFLRRNYDSLGLLDVHFKIYDLLASRFEYKEVTIPGDTFHTGKISATGWKGLAAIDSPNAITGRSANRESLMSMACDPNSFLIWDNAYGEFAGDEVPPDLPSNVVVVRSFSKFYGLAGLRIGYCVGDPALIRELLDRKDAFNVNGVAQRMALEALKRQDTFRQIANELIGQRDGLVRALERLGFEVHPPSGNYVLARHRSIPGRLLHQKLLERQIAVRHFSDSPTEEYIRVTVPPQPGVDRFLDALSALLDAHDPHISSSGASVDRPRSDQVQ